MLWILRTLDHHSKSKLVSEYFIILLALYLKLLCDPCLGDCEREKKVTYWYLGRYVFSLHTCNKNSPNISPALIFIRRYIYQELLYFWVAYLTFQKVILISSLFFLNKQDCFSVEGEDLRHDFERLQLAMEMVGFLPKTRRQWVCLLYSYIFGREQNHNVCFTSSSSLVLWKNFLTNIPNLIPPC